MGEMKDELTSGLEEGMGRVHDPVLMESVVASKIYFLVIRHSDEICTRMTLCILSTATTNKCKSGPTL